MIVTNLLQYALLPDYDAGIRFLGQSMVYWPETAE